MLDIPVEEQQSKRLADGVNDPCDLVILHEVQQVRAELHIPRVRLGGAGV